MDLMPVNRTCDPYFYRVSVIWAIHSIRHPCPLGPSTVPHLSTLDFLTAQLLEHCAQKGPKHALVVIPCRVCPWPFWSNKSNGPACPVTIWLIQNPNSLSPERLFWSTAVFQCLQIQSLLMKFILLYISLLFQALTCRRKTTCALLV